MAVTTEVGYLCATVHFPPRNNELNPSAQECDTDRIDDRRIKVSRIQFSGDAAVASKHKTMFGRYFFTLKNRTAVCRNSDRSIFGIF